MNETQPTLPKWPFYVGDVLLVGIALLLAFRGGGALDAAQMFWVIGAVGLGAVLFVLPFIIEYRTRIAIAESGRDAEIWENTERMEAALQQAATAFTRQKADRETIERSLAFLEGLSRQLEERALRVVNEVARPVEKEAAWPDQEVEESEAQVETELSDESEQSEPDDESEESEPDDESELSDESDESESTEESDEPEASDETDYSEAPDESEVFPLAQQELIEVGESGRRGRKRVKGSVLVVDALIGIGNKPYLRGEGGGLSWQRGVPMEFVEIGKWQWLAEGSTEDIRCRVYRNDELAAEGDEIVIPAGQRVSVSANFPRS